MHNASGNRTVRIRMRVLPWPLRGMTWALVISQVLLPFSNHPFLYTSGAQTAVVSPSATYPAPVLTPQHVTVNRTVPDVEPPSAELRFSAQPSAAEIAKARVFPSPLIAGSQSSDAQENAGLAQALSRFQQRTDPDEATDLEGFLSQHPQSRWAVSLRAHLAGHYRRTYQFTKAMAHWEQLSESAKSVTDGSLRDTVNEALAEYAQMLVTFGRKAELDALLKDMAGREVYGASRVHFDDAASALWQMEHLPTKTFKCGPYSLYRMRFNMNLPEANHELIHQELSSTNGTSLFQIWSLAKRLGMDVQMAKRSPGAAIPLPCVVHWKHEHFSALARAQDGTYFIEDPTFQGSVSARVLDEEASGYFLIPGGALPAGWQPASEEEARNVWGRSTPEVTDQRAGPGCGGNGGGFAAGGPGTKPCAEGMAMWTVQLLRASLVIEDIPVGYAPPVGPGVDFHLTYYEREVLPVSTPTFNYSNLGKQWQHNWMSYVADDTTKTNDPVNVMLGGGGYETYTYNTNTQSYEVQRWSQTRLTRASSTSYERLFPDGSVEVFSVPDATNGVRRIFLSERRDPAGKAVTLTYDGSFRVVSLTDAIGQVATFSYELPGDSLKITKVTDPFGRYASFYYNTNVSPAQLTNITDVIGISSQFTYQSGSDFIKAMTTPYGTTTFTNGTGLQDYRWIEITDPAGEKERVEYRHGAPIESDDPPSLVPTGMQTGEGSLAMDNTFYWDRKAMRERPYDYSAAHITHWAISAAYWAVSPTKESEKRPLENRVYYNYTNQTRVRAVNAWVVGEGTYNLPSKVGRVLDDGATQLYSFDRNAIAKVTKAIDPVGRATLYSYETNLVDLLEVRQQTGSTNQRLATFTYNAQHRPLTYVDAAGQTNYFGWNANGQLTAATNALGEVVTLAYDTNGYLTNVTGALPGATTSVTYDGYGRTRTVTDADGYTVTYDYDAFDRPTKVTYPDTTYEQMVYDRLDLSLRKDRRGHWERRFYNERRLMTAVSDALGRITSFDWCKCGDLESITDPVGNMTSWLRDLQGRPTAKIYPDGSQVQYKYEWATSRLRSVTDAKNQTTLYEYFKDDNLKSVTYSNAVIATPSVAFTYDTNYNRLLTMTDGIGTTTYAYHTVTNGVLGAGRLASVDGPLSNDTVTYHYDALGRVTNRAIDSVAQTVAYDALGRVTVVSNVLGSFTNVYVGATARIATNFYPNGQVTTFSYYGTNDDLRLQTIQNLSHGTNLSKFDYTYDADGQIATWTQQADAGTPNVWVTEYDPVDQLLGVTVRSNSITGDILKRFLYGYDRAGNRTSEQIESSAGVPPAVATASHNNLNQLTAVTGGGPTRFKGSLNEMGTVTVAGSSATFDSRNSNFVGSVQTTLGTNVVPVVATDYSSNVRSNVYQLVVTNNGVAQTLTYDPNGNLTNVISATSTNTYEWDAADRLIAINAGTNRSEFTYDGYGRRVKLIEKQNSVAVSTNCFLWSDLELCEERNNSGATVTKRFFGQGEQISGANYLFTRDHLGSVREMMDTGGVIRARYDYDPYGRRTKISGDLDADFGFTGHYYHAPSGLHLAVFRAYDAESARWLSRDPIEEEGGLNLYAYVLNDPIRNTDPDGRCIILVVGAIALVGMIVSAQYKWSKDAELKQTLKKIQDERVKKGDDGAWGTMGQQWVGEQAATTPDVAKSLSVVGTSVSGFGPPAPIESGADAAVNAVNYLTDYEGALEDAKTVRDAFRKEPTCQKK